MDTELWAVRLDRELSGQEQAALWSLLPPERRRRLDRVKHTSQRQEALCAYGLLYLAAREILGWERLPEIALASTGKPWFPRYPRVQFNLSHTAGAVLAGISEGAIGVDIEKIRPVSPRLMDRVADTDCPEKFFRSWVYLEATGKRDGEGLRAVIRGGSPQGDGLYHQPDLFPGYAAGAAVSPGCGVRTVRRWSLSECVPEQI